MISFLLSDLVQEEFVTGSDDVTGRRLIHKTGDVLLGTTILPLTALLTHRTGKLSSHGLGSSLD